MEVLPKEGGALAETGRNVTGDAGAIAEQGAQHTSALAAERYRIEGMIIAAERRPRDEERARDRVLKSCKRPRFAEGATYEFPRGGSVVTGPSVNLAREMARAWGNIMTGYRIVDMDDVWITIEGFAYDVETNTVLAEQSRFKRMVQRKPKDARGRTIKGAPATWVRIDDERDLMELVGRNAAKRQRNCILNLMPFDIREEALEICYNTALQLADRELKGKKIEEVIEDLLEAFEHYGVERDAIEAFLKRPMEEMTDGDLVKLRGVYRSIKAGEGKVDEFFDVKPAEPAKAGVRPEQVHPEGGSSPADAKKEDAAGAPEADGKDDARRMPTSRQLTKLRKVVREHGTKEAFIDWLAAEFEIEVDDGTLNSACEAIKGKLGEDDVEVMIARIEQGGELKQEEDAGGEDEVPTSGGSAEESPASSTPERTRSSSSDGPTDEQIRRIVQMLDAHEVKRKDLDELLAKLFQVENERELTVERAAELITGIESGDIWSALD